MCAQRHVPFVCVSEIALAGQVHPLSVVHLNLLASALALTSFSLHEHTADDADISVFAAG